MREGEGGMKMIKMAGTVAFRDKPRWTWLMNMLVSVSKHLLQLVVVCSDAHEGAASLAKSFDTHHRAIKFSNQTCSTLYDANIARTSRQWSVPQLREWSNSCLVELFTPRNWFGCLDRFTGLHSILDWLPFHLLTLMFMVFATNKHVAIVLHPWFIQIDQITQSRVTGLLK